MKESEVEVVDKVEWMVKRTVNENDRFEREKAA